MSLVQQSGVMEELPIDLPNGYEVTRVPDTGRGKGPNACLKLTIESRKEFDNWLNDLSQKNNIKWLKITGDRLPT